MTALARKRPPGTTANVPAWVAAAVLIGLIAAAPAAAQELTISLGEEGGGLSGRVVQLLLVLTVLSLAPGLAIMITCFPFIVTVLAILRQGIGLQQSPPNMLIVSLALFLTYFVMAPVFEEAWRQGIAPLIAEEIAADEALRAALAPFRVFMAARLDPATFELLAAIRGAEDAVLMPDADLSLLIPSFLLSRDRARVPDRFPDLPAVPHHRPRGRCGADVDGHDDGAAGDRFAALQACVLRRGRRLDACRRSVGAQLLLARRRPPRSLAACFLSADDEFGVQRARGLDAS